MNRVIILLSALLFIMAACGEKTPPYVMKAGDQILDGETVLFYYKRSGMYTEKKEVTRQQLLNFTTKYLEKNLLYQAEGYARGLDQDTVVLRQREIGRQKIMTGSDGILQKHAVPKDIEVTEQEIQHYYDQLDRQIHIAYIQLKSKRRADSLYLALRRGADFAQAAQRYSTDARTANRGGDLGRYTLWGYLGPAIDSVAFKLEPGQISAPIPTYVGYYIVKLIDKKPIERAPFDSLKATLETKLRAIKTGDWTEKYMTGLLDKYELKIDSSAIPYVKAMYTENNGIPILDRSKIDVPSLQKVLVTHKMGAWNVDNFAQVFNTTPRYLRHKLELTDQIVDFIKKSVTQELLYYDALDRGLDNDVEFIKIAELNDDALVARRCKELLVNEAVQVSEDELVDYYNTNRVRFGNRSYEAARESVRNQVLAEKIEAKEKEVLEQLRKKYKIKVNEKEVDRLVEALNMENLEKVAG